MFSNFSIDIICYHTKIESGLKKSKNIYTLILFTLKGLCNESHLFIV